MTLAEWRPVRIRTLKVQSLLNFSLCVPKSSGLEAILERSWSKNSDRVVRMVDIGDIPLRVDERMSKEKIGVTIHCRRQTPPFVKISSLHPRFLR